jgi:hypothetical protein
VAERHRRLAAHEEVHKYIRNQGIGLYLVVLVLMLALRRKAYTSLS